VKDLIRACKKDSPELMPVRVQLGKWNILQSDLIELLLTHPQDKILSYYLIILMVQLTEFPLAESPHFTQVVEFLRVYKESFLRKDAIKTLMAHLADCLEARERGRTHEQMIELIVVLLRNLLQVPDRPESGGTANELEKNLHFHTLVNFIRENAIDAIIFMTQEFESPLMCKLDLTFLEIFYHIFASFDIKQLVSGDETDSIERMVREDAQSLKLQKPVGRHSRFRGFFQQKRVFDGTRSMRSKPFTNEQGEQS